MQISVCRLPRAISAAVLVLLLGGSQAFATHYRVYLLGGQSNASGRGDAAQLVAPLASPQTDVRLYWHRTQDTTNVGWLAEDQWIDLAPGSGHGTTSPVYPKEFGSELSFGRTLADANPAAHIAIIKYTHGGTNLHSQWSATGDKYAAFVATVQAGLTGLTAAGHTYELRGMIWHQGEADTTSIPNASAYQANLTSLVQRVRQDLNGGQALPFVIGSLSNSQDSSITTPGTGFYLVRQAQQTVAQNGTQTGFVNTDGYPTRPGEAIHFNHQGQISLGQGFASEILRLEAVDADNDGLTLDQETSLGTDPFNPDSDGDSQNDGLEVSAGTNPLSGSSSFKVVSVTTTGNQVSLQWPSKPGNTYRIERSSNLVDWTTAAANVPAAAAASLTIWNGLLQESSAVVLARYNAQTGLNGNFNTTAFDSVDSDPATTATRLTQGGSLTGGGSNLFVLANALFGSGSPGFNFADIATASQSAAATAGDFFSFTVQSGGSPMTYQSLSFYNDQFGTTGKVDVSHTIGGTQTFILQGFVPTGSNATVTLKTIDFADFTTAENVTWTFYLYGATGTSPAASLHGTRFDDITLNGQAAVAPPSQQFYRVVLVASGS